MTRSRLAPLRARLRDSGIDALFVSSIHNIRYLTGFTGSNALLVIRPRTAYFLTDARYILQSRAEVRGVSRIISRTTLIDGAARNGLLRSCRSVGFEAEHVPYAVYRELRRRFSGSSFRPTRGLVEDLAVHKDRRELAMIEQAVRITDTVFQKVLTLIRPGIRELDLAAEISYLHRRLGAEHDAFEPIVASGERGALPHARASMKQLRVGDFLTLDFGCTVGGYSSDLTRTVAVGKVTRRKREIYAAVLEAQTRAVGAARGGMWARDLDRIARESIESAGYGRYFTHSLGHGLGLQVHERPRVSAASRDRLEPGNVITIEPGIYIPKECGVRIEDDVVLTSRGCRILNRAPKELLVI